MKIKMTLHYILGGRDDIVVRALASHQCGPGSIPGPGVVCRLSLLLVLTLLRGFFSGFSGFSSPTKADTPNSISARIEHQHENQLRLNDVAYSLNIVVYYMATIVHAL